ncbi:uncharacterized protein BO80DRAFT_448148 [Aspergillus ibericus CBS 121593]|uniref:Uncharacterized protein n=1 Tax=Aspergillus ibericus CBS 121593 TaxID=1448316 RepID=A0A395GQJ1_9EURO|nr:hypothetical protein BO80DRAFT_448148 [Aspergillus ibericus CBS 121593]RAK97749.1 hypothetical protein BO80DRAFT_448148 [Aspergillus ibericus CBS 121593]
MADPQQRPDASPVYMPPTGWYPPMGYSPNRLYSPHSGPRRVYYAPRYPYPMQPNRQMVSPVARSTMAAQGAQTPTIGPWQPQHPIPNSPAGMPMPQARVMYRQPGELITFPHSPQSVGQGQRELGEPMFIGYNPQSPFAPGQMGNSVFMGYNSPTAIQGPFQGLPTPDPTIGDPIHTLPSLPSSNTQGSVRSSAGRVRKQPRRLKLIIEEADYVKGRTAKCDHCKAENAEDVWRCKPCGHQICVECTGTKSNRRSHWDRGLLHMPYDVFQLMLDNVHTKPATGARQSEPKPEAQTQTGTEADSSRMQRRRATPAVVDDAAVPEPDSTCSGSAN